MINNINVTYRRLDSHDKYVATFSYSSVSVTPRFSLLIYKQKQGSHEYDEHPTNANTSEGETAIKDMRTVIEELEKITHLLDR